jgi:hypothetical protein
MNKVQRTHNPMGWIKTPGGRTPLRTTPGYDPSVWCLSSRGPVREESQGGWLYARCLHYAMYRASFSAIDRRSILSRERETLHSLCSPIACYCERIRQMPTNTFGKLVERGRGRDTCIFFLRILRSQEPCNDQPASHVVKENKIAHFIKWHS